MSRYVFIRKGKNKICTELIKPYITSFTLISKYALMQQKSRQPQSVHFVTL